MARRHRRPAPPRPPGGRRRARVQSGPRRPHSRIPPADYLRPGGTRTRACTHWRHPGSHGRREPTGRARIRARRHGRRTRPDERAVVLDVPAPGTPPTARRTVATRSTTSAPSPSRPANLGEAADGVWASPAANCSPTQARRARAREVAARLPGAAEMLSLPPKESRPRHESLAPSWCPAWTPLDLLPAGSPILASDPERNPCSRCRPRRH